MIIIEKLIFYLFVFCLPLQTRKIIYQWGDGFNEWSSAFLFLTDILLIAMLLLWFWRIRKQRFLKKSPFKKQDLLKDYTVWIIVFLIISFFSMSQANNIQLGFYTWFKLLELVALLFYIKCNVGLIFCLKRIAQVVIASGFIQSIIVFGQFINQKSLGLRFLTESPIGIEVSGIAKIMFDGMKIIRPYGTFLHPNILAAFLLLCIFLLYYRWLDGEYSVAKNCFSCFIYCSLFFALWLTFSRTAIIACLVASLVYFNFIFWHARETNNKALKQKLFLIFLTFVLCCLFFVSLAWPEVSHRFIISMGEQAVGLRLAYNEIAFFIISQYPWLGIGLGNFTWEIAQIFNLLQSWMHQPVHNVYLLISSEVGLIGLGVFLLFLWRLFAASKKEESNSRLFLPISLFFTVICFLFIAFFDHFFWSLQQGQLMFWLTLGMIAAYHKS